MLEKPYSFKVFGVEAIAILLALIFIAPFYFVFGNSVKSFAELLTNTASLPTSLHWDNYSRAWEALNFPLALRNSFVITVLSNIGLVFISSMAAYRLVRHPSRLNRVLFSLFVAAMVIPFQTIMIPMVKLFSWLSLINTIPGIVICYMGLGVSFTIFLYCGFIKSIPREIEESAVVDGCTPYGTFFRIIVPLLKPMTVTAIVLNSLWIWNDFLTPLLFLQKPGLQTIQTATNTLFGQYMKQWDLALAALVMGMIPVMVFFLCLQRFVIKGIADGAVKG
ncbi:carbohydrate ABC transporter permease [Paenibacillus beijingensis]|uniref:Sugar ABC transporter permease n=1 Tax=Paenibacillus beijingensis TaxID=1126833 RepID=A0A0D5NLI0_9BACL|nr:carbohydrate ABC transporter permease [Paenibacillus beijingensis]AJY76174.1 sugar ABC transporter permease [Paenibacillus beijingensis]